ncbi:MAG: hypothetical protein Q8M49_16340 [Limnobacter sp.]|nr:hypothetical protein [Limnobacter sp.]
MNIRNLRVEVECPDCDTTSQVSIGSLETGGYTCPHCGEAHHFDKAHATRLRDGIECHLSALHKSLGRIEQ